MFDTKAILQLYTNVMYGDVVNHCIKNLDVSAALSNVSGVYSQDFGPRKVLDYNSVANRCAYLHGYAPLYTAIVRDTMLRILNDGTTVRLRLESDPLRMCSLGGGPGTDVVGVLVALDWAFSSLRWNTIVSIVDHMDGWRHTFKSVVKELKRFGYRPFASRFAEESFSTNYIEGDLLDSKKHKVWDAVSSSTLVTVVKCLSTFRPKDVPNVVKKIFRAMCYGSFVLIIDENNAKLTDMMLRLANEHQMITLFGPMWGIYHSYDEFRVTKFGHLSCHRASIDFILLLKPLINPRPTVGTPRCCANCGNPIEVCAICSQISPAHGSRQFGENEFHTPPNSRSSSPGLPRTDELLERVDISPRNDRHGDRRQSLLPIFASDAVVVEIPE